MSAAAAAPAAQPDSIQVQLGGQAYTLKPLTFGGWKANAAKLRGLAEGTISDVAEVMDAITDVVHAALVRSHPDLARQTVEDALDWQTGQQLYTQVLSLSVPLPTPGETLVASPPGASTGPG